MRWIDSGHGPICEDNESLDTLLMCKEGIMKQMGLKTDREFRDMVTKVSRERRVPRDEAFWILCQENGIVPVEVDIEVKNK